MDVNVKTKYLKIVLWREGILLTLCLYACLDMLL